jgi:hypothetical protein
MPFDNTNFESELDHDLRILRAALEGISKPGGWCQRMFNKGAAHCSVGWVLHAAGLGPSPSAVRFALKLLEPCLPDKHKNDGLIIWQDYYAKKDDVVTLFSRTIARLERERE